MKNQFKLLTLAASAAMMFTACSSDKLEAYAGQPDLNPEAPSNAIQFGTYLGKTGTRAGATGAQATATLATNGFGVFAYNTGSTTLTSGSAIGSFSPNFMYNEKVSSADGGATWTYTPVKYWPNGIDAANAANSPSNTASETTATQYLSFFAYAPHVALTGGALTGAGITNINGTNVEGGASGTPGTGNQKAGDPTITYAFATNDFSLENNVDLLWGMANTSTSSYNETDGTAPSDNAYNINLTKQNTPEKISFLFKHALAKLGGSNGLKVQLDVDDNDGGALLDANTHVTISSIVIKNVANKVATGGTFDLATGTWSDVSMATISQQTIADLGSSTIATGLYAASGATYNGSAWDVAGVTNTPTAVYKDANAGFFMMPSLAGQELEVTITYTVSTYDAKLHTSHSKITQTIKNTVTLPALASNKFYTLILHLGLTSVKFSATVDNWDTTGGDVQEEIWLPSNVVGATLAASTTPTSFNVTAGTTSFTLTLTGLTANTEHDVTGTVNYAGTDLKFTTDGTGKGTVVIPLNANTDTSNSKTSVITIKESSTDKAVINIIQAKANS